MTKREPGLYLRNNLKITLIYQYTFLYYYFFYHCSLRNVLWCLSRFTHLKDTDVVLYTAVPATNILKLSSQKMVIQCSFDNEKDRSFLVSDFCTNVSFIFFIRFETHFCVFWFCGINDSYCWTESNYQYEVTLLL